MGLCPVIAKGIVHYDLYHHHGHLVKEGSHAQCGNSLYMGRQGPEGAKGQVHGLKTGQIPDDHKAGYNLPDDGCQRGPGHSHMEAEYEQGVQNRIDHSACKGAYHGVPGASVRAHQMNISRELLQHDRQLKVIAANLEKKIKAELGKLLKDDREGYEKFWKNFGRQIKYGAVSEYGAHKDLLSDLLLFYSSTEKKPVTLAEYVSRMPEDQKYIYFAAGESPDKIDKLPQTELLKDKGTEILYFTEEVDEFCAQILHTFQEKEFRSILDQEVEEGAKEKAQEAQDAHKATFDFVKEALGDQVKEVKASTRLKSHPVCLTAGEGLSFEMEKYFQAVQPDSGIKADRILELNVEHPAFAALESAVTADPEKAKKYAALLYDQALLIAGLPLEDPSGYTDLVCELMK